MYATATKKTQKILHSASSLATDIAADLVLQFLYEAMFAKRPFSLVEYHLGSGHNFKNILSLTFACPSHSLSSKVNKVISKHPFL